MIQDNVRARLLAGSVIIGLLAVGATPALAAAAAAAAGPVALQEVVVTAQKRAQNLQEVPISVTALDRETMRANRVNDVRDLNAIAPNVTVRSGVGGSNIPSYTIRGLYAQAAAAGSDKGVSVYLDGVYLGNALGSIFQLADIEQIEILKGPQGTLFGRNSTGGAVTITTLNPKGVFGVEQTFTYGNYNQVVSKTRVDLPAWGPLSASVAYMHSQRDGDVKNLAAGTVWDFTAATKGRLGKLTTPARLGDENSDAVQIGLHLDATENLTFNYKYDYTNGQHTPEAEGVVAQNDLTALGGLGAYYASVLATQSPATKAILTQVSTKRPDAVNNELSFEGYTRVEGHNLTADLKVNDNISVRNIASYRWVHSFGSMELDGYSGLINTNAAPVQVAPGVFLPMQPGTLGAPEITYANLTEQSERQWSDEIIVNVDTKLVHVTGGYIHFGNHIKVGIPGIGQSIGLGDRTGLGVGFPGLTIVSLGIYPGRVVPGISSGISTYTVSSDAFYVQPEFHVTDKLDLVAGYRITMDRKAEHFRQGVAPLDSKYSKNRPTYFLGLNYKVTDQIFAYAKYSTGYISGGSASSIAYKPETSISYEAGIKTDLFDRRLRSNLAVFSVDYTSAQQSATGRGIGRPELAIILINAYDLKAKGFEWENTALPMEGLTLTANIGYTQSDISNISPLYAPFSQARAAFRPKWTGEVAAQYEVRDMPGDSRLILRVDGNYRSLEYTNPFSNGPLIAAALTTPSTWLVNAHVALADIKVANTTAEVSLWGRNLTDNGRVTFGAPFPVFATGMYERARTYGVDVNFKF
jgi:iron complex outermembrane receptor protein